MSNIHTPERQPGESQPEYRARQRSSQYALRAITKPPRQAPAQHALDFRRFWLGQHTNPKKNKLRAQKVCYSKRQWRKWSGAVTRAVVANGLSRGSHV